MNTALLESSGLALSWMLTYLIHSTILILSVWLLCRGIKPIARRIGPGGENLAWKLAIVGAFVTATVQISAGITPALGALEFSTAPQLSHSEIAAEPAETPELAGQAPVVIRVHPSDQPVMLRAGPPSAGLTPLAPLAPPSEAASVVERSAPPPAPAWPFVVLAVWGLGTLIAAGRLMLSVRGLRKRLADREEVIVDPVLETFLTLCRDAEIKRKIRLTQSTQIESPIALWRREVVVPQRAVEELSPAAMRSVLAHELAHLERRDPHWLAFAALLEVLCFFQPLNRLARRGMQESAELLCDDWAIAQTGDAVQFAKSLAELASWNQVRNSSLLVAGMVSGDRPLVQRVRRALDGDPRRFKAEESPRPARVLFGLGTLAALIMVAPGAVDASAPPKAAAEDSEAKQSKAERKARKAREKAEQEAAKAEAKARQAQAKAEQAQREAEQAMRAAERARSEAEASMRAQGQLPLGDGQAQGQQHLVIRDGENYLIVDGRGLQLRGEGADVVIIDGENPRVRMRIDDGQTKLDLDLDAESIESFVEELIEGEGMQLEGLLEGMEALGGLEGMEALGGLEGLGALGGMDPREMQELAREMEALQHEAHDIERELIEELVEEGLGGLFGPGFPRADAETIERETEREMRRAERELERLIEQQRRELEQHQRELERHRRELERHQRRSAPEAPHAPHAPVTPQVAPPAPPAAPAPVVAI